MFTYIAEMTITITLAGSNPSSILSLIDKEILTNPNLNVESLIITKKE